MTSYFISLIAICVHVFTKSLLSLRPFIIIIPVHWNLCLIFTTGTAHEEEKDLNI